jgi:cell division protein FtsB
MIFLAITWYFGWNALHGTRGLEAQSAERSQLTRAQEDFATVDATRATWETRVTALGGPSIAPDMLDEEARKVLNLSDPSDLVVKLSPQQTK